MSETSIDWKGLLNKVLYAGADFLASKISASTGKAGAAAEPVSFWQKYGVFVFVAGAIVFVFILAKAVK